jgi:hypothetical protein
MSNPTPEYLMARAMLHHKNALLEMIKPEPSNFLIEKDTMLCHFYKEKAREASEFRARTRVAQAGTMRGDDRREQMVV